MDEPHADPSAVALYFVDELAAKKVKAVLSGEGADELFGGYDEYTDTPNMKKYKNLPAPAKMLANLAAKVAPNSKIGGLVNRAKMPVEETFIGQAHIFDESESTSILKPTYNNAPSVKDIVTPYYDRFKGKDDVTKKQLLDMNLWIVDDILLKADKMSMAHSIELRVPLLDLEMMKVASSVPTRFRVNDEMTKFAFRKAAAKALPSAWANHLNRSSKIHTFS